MFRRAVQDSTGFAPSLGLSAEERRFFQENGYLVKHDAVPEELTARAIDYSWTHFPDRFDRNRPETWKGLVEDSLCERTVDARKGRVKFRECVRGEPWLYDMIDQNACIRSTVEAMLGSQHISHLPYIRGLYPVVPCGSARIKVPRPHTDGHCFFVGTLTYLAEVEEGGGGFHVWPGSHLLMRQHFKTVAGSGWTDDYHRRLYQMAKFKPAVEIVAPRGSVIFWHHRLAHAAGINRSNAIRHAVLGDFRPGDYERIHSLPVSSDPWEHWSEMLHQ